MTQAGKLLQRMRNNPRDWRIQDIQSLADSLGIDWLHNGGSHVVFRSPSGDHLTIPSHRPIKPIYIVKFLALIDSLKEAGDEGRTE